MHPAECASEIEGTVALRSASGFGRLSVQARNGFRRLSAGGLTKYTVVKNPHDTGNSSNNCTPLAHVFNMSLQEGIVPLEWKEANIIPLFKNGSRNKSVNYRPVSLTSVICKVLETIIRDHMMDFLIKHKLINPSQHGFLKARSCLTNLLCFLRE